MKRAAVPAKFSVDAVNFAEHFSDRCWMYESLLTFYISICCYNAIERKYNISDQQAYLLMHGIYVYVIQCCFCFIIINPDMWKCQFYVR